MKLDTMPHRYQYKLEALPRPVYCQNERAVSSDGLGLAVMLIGPQLPAPAAQNIFTPTF